MGHRVQESSGSGNLDGFIEGAVWRGVLVSVAGSFFGAEGLTVCVCGESGYIRLGSGTRDETLNSTTALINPQHQLFRMVAGAVADDNRYLPRLKPPADKKIRPKWLLGGAC